MIVAWNRKLQYSNAKYVDYFIGILTLNFIQQDGIEYIFPDCCAALQFIIQNLANLLLKYSKTEFSKFRI